MSNLAKLQRWYESHYNGDWEHHYGVTIETLDSPGWSVTVDLVETALEGAKLEETTAERTERDWIHCRWDAHSFKGHGGPGNLEEILAIFLERAAAST